MALLLLALSAGCADVPPVAKIGLIAPFEGLYRESGYGALEALRQALADCTPPGMAVVPLALDNAADPARARRAAQKLLVDPAVQAVIGPLELASTAAVAEVMAAPAGESRRPLPWIAPALVEPAGGYPLHPSDASPGALAAAALASADAPPRRLLVVGLPDTLAGDLPAAVEGVPVYWLADGPAALAAWQEGDAVLWLGQEAEAAAFLLAAGRPLPLWLGPQAGHAVLTAHLAAAGERSGAFLPSVRWLIWTDSGYTRWLQSSSTADPSRYLVYRAVCTALMSLGRVQLPPSEPWQMQHIRLEVNGGREQITTR
ncbi:MAG TPA: ABC transporter substrate-binding protein [Caldilineaceae bacterium]|nr:ABC transporter substrate-binding protein [Caldilineaceae bacterium]